MIERYRDLFVHREDVYAQQQHDGQGYLCIRQPVTDEVLADHLEGEITCGFYCLRADNSVKWAVADFDHERGVEAAKQLHRRMADLDIPTYIEESRQGRAHLWLFTPTWPAKSMRLLVRSLVEDPHIEV